MMPAASGEIPVVILWPIYARPTTSTSLYLPAAFGTLLIHYTTLTQLLHWFLEVVLILARMQLATAAERVIDH